jgi:hypothetical protein
MLNIDFIKKLEKPTLYIALISFIGHIFLYYCRDFVPLFAQIIPDNYLTAIYTPFSFIIFYEILELVSTLPKSMTTFFGKQLEIISLIFIRDVFKGIANLKGHEFDANQETIIGILIGTLTGVILFVIASQFKRLALSKKKLSFSEIKKFIKIKEGISFFLIIGILIISGIDLSHWIYNLIIEINAGNNYHVPIHLIPLDKVFELLILVDVSILIISLFFSQNYAVVARNSLFIISTIFLRYSLSMSVPYNGIFAIIAGFLGITSLYIFVKYKQI